MTCSLDLKFFFSQLSGDLRSFQFRNKPLGIRSVYQKRPWHHPSICIFSFCHWLRHSLCRMTVSLSMMRVCVCVHVCVCACEYVWVCVGILALLPNTLSTPEGPDSIISLFPAWSQHRAPPALWIDHLITWLVNSFLSLIKLVFPCRIKFLKKFSVGIL